MKTVNCDECKHFVNSVWRDDYDKPIKMLEKAYCKLGKSIRFIMNKRPYPYADGAYRRKCELFETK